MSKKRNRNRAAGRCRVNATHKVTEKVPKGLINVGNTCYLNSALQCISRVSGLPKWIEKFARGGLYGYLRRSTNDGKTQSLRLPLPQEQMPFSRSFTNFVDDLLGSHNSRASITPEALRLQLVNFYKQLNNFGQHDSHEALRCILDRLRVEERNLWQRSILNEMKYHPSASNELKNDIRSWGKSTGVCTAVDRIFGGVLLTSLWCTVCKNNSIHFETFLDLSLPILVDECKPELVQDFQKSHMPKKKKQDRKGRKGKKRFDMHYFEEDGVNNRCDIGGGGGYEDGEEAEKFTAYNAKRRQGKRNEKTPKKNKYGRRRLEESNVEENGKNVSGLQGEEEESESGVPNAIGKNENTYLPLGSTLDDSDTDNASLEPNRGSDIGDLIDDVDVSNRSTGSPESVQDLLEVGKAFGGVQEDTRSTGDGNSSIESRSKSSPNSISTGDIADMEDNSDGVDGVSGISLPKTAFDEEALCSNFIAKSRIADADNETAIAQPEEERQAKDLSVCTILSQDEVEVGTDLERCLFRYFETDELKGTNQITCEECTKRANGGDSGHLSSDGRSTNSKDGRVLCDSLKRDLLIKLPAILTIHLKRYQRIGNQLRKCNRAVTFPINLDLRPFCSRLAWLGVGEGHYRLFGVVEHSGALNSGHYVAYVAENTDGDVPSEVFIPSLEKPFPWPLNLHHLVYQLRRGDKDVLHGKSGSYSLSDSSDDRTWHYFSDTSVHRVTVSQVLSAKPYLLFYQRIR